MNKITLIPLTATFFLTCLTEPPPDAPRTLSFPLDIGTQWEYKVTGTLDDSLIDSFHIFSRITSREENDDGDTIIEFSEWIDTVVWKHFFVKRSSGLYLVSADPGNTPALWKKSVHHCFGPVEAFDVLVPFSFDEGGVWMYDSVMDSSEGVPRYLYRSHYGREEVTTDAGTFLCDKFNTDGLLDEFRTHYYADSVGLVLKKVVVDSFGVTRVDSVGSIVVDYRESVRMFSLVSYE